MIPGVILGRRALNNPDVGLFIAPAGVNAETASPDQLVVNLTQAISQIVMIGSVPAGSTVVPLGFTRPPYVLLNTFQVIADGVGSTFSGRFRPSPFDVQSNGARAIINNNGQSMTVVSGLGSSFVVLNKALA